MRARIALFVDAGAMMGLKTMGEDERALTRGITFDKYDMVEKIMMNRFVEVPSRKHFLSTNPVFSML